MRRFALIAGIVAAVITTSVVGVGPAQALTGDTTPYKKAYGTFESFSRQGKTSTVIKLPAAVKTGIIIATYRGSSEFSIEGLDSANQQNGDLPVYHYGAYSGTTAFGLDSYTTTRALRVTGTGAWSLTVKQMSRAPFLTKTGRGDHVYLSGAKARNVRITNRGEGYFGVFQTPLSQGYSNLVVNEIGPWTGVVPLVKGPSVIQVQSDGAWSIK
jgi:hypothetical protein